MEESVPETTMLDGEQHMITAAYHIVKALAASKTMKDDTKRIVTELEVHLSTMTKIGDIEAEKTWEIERKLKFAQKTIAGFQSKHLKIWDACSGESGEYLQAVDEVRRLAESLESKPSHDTRKVKELLEQAHNILQMAMAELQEELVRILAQNVQQLDNRSVLFSSCEETVADEGSIVSTEDYSLDQDAPSSERHSTEYDNYTVDLIHPHAIPLIRHIAQVMFAAQYNQEFCQTFISFWKHVSDDYLISLNIKQLSIEDVLNMEWKSLNGRVKNWCHATRSVLGIYLTNKKRLFNRILGEFGSTSTSCFVEATKVSVLCLLNFGQAVTVGPLRPERLFCLLDMYEVLSNHQRDIEDLFAEEIGSLVRMEFHELRDRLCSSAKGILLEFGHQIASNTSTIPFTNGGIHPLTKYVMNYIMLLEEYGDTINSLLDERNVVNLGKISNREVVRSTSSSVSSPMAHLLQSVASILEANLDAKSDLYRDQSLKHIFMMNNIHYMVRKIKNSIVRTYFGDEWIRRHVGKFRQHATIYERIAWSNILSMLRDDGNNGKANLKQKCREFTAAFEELHKSQTGWLIPDRQLREELRIMTSQKVVHAYRPYAGRIRSFIGDKYIKYTEYDLGNHIWDLFEGSPKSLNHQRRR